MDDPGQPIALPLFCAIVDICVAGVQVSELATEQKRSNETLYRAVMAVLPIHRLVLPFAKAEVTEHGMSR